MKRAYGFTIVELLIVIVVIAILAAISVAAYTSISQRANNTSIKNTASNVKRMLEASIAESGKYPYVSTTESYICVTTDSGCQGTSGNAVNGNAAFDAAVASVGVLPKSMPNSLGAANGVIYSYLSTRTVEGNVQPAIITYWLQGVNQDCGVGGVITYNNPHSMSTAGYTHGDQAGGKTRCMLTIAGPAHS